MIYPKPEPDVKQNARQSGVSANWHRYILSLNA